MDPTFRARIRAGDTEAFAHAFEEHAGAVYRHGVRLTADWSAAEETVSLTFHEAWRLRGRLNPDGGSVLPWLLGIATNVVRNLRRTARRHQAALARLPARQPAPDFADELVERMHDSEELAVALAALRRLRPAEREVFALCVWSELDYRSAAEALGVPVGTVRSRLSRARDRLRALAEDESRQRRADRELALRSGQTPDGRGFAARLTQGRDR